MSVIKVNRLTKFYSKSKVPSLKNATFKVDQGDWHGFIGRNGAGKTTTIKILIGAVKKSSGSASIYGFNAGSKEAKKLIGYVPEKTSFAKGILETTKNFLSDIAVMKGVPLNQIKEKIESLTDKLGVHHLLNKNPYNFSSGEKRRILVVQALLNDPKILILDEPTANLDPDSRRFVLELLKELTDEKKMTVFISSHVLSEIQKYVTGWTMIESGQILQNKTLQSFGNDSILGYEIGCDDTVILGKYLSSKGYKDFEILHSKNRVYLKIQKNNSKIINLQKTIASSPIKIDYFSEYAIDLEETYIRLLEKNE